MVVKVELKEFISKDKCKDFVNDFIKDKKLRQTKIVPLIKKDSVTYFVFIEYEY